MTGAVAWGSPPGVLCVGEPLVGLTPTSGSLRTAGELAVGVAGAELNVAVHLARLGVPVRFAGRVGADPFGLRLRDVLVAEGVDVGALEVDRERPTGLYAKDPRGEATDVHYYRAGSAATQLSSVPQAALADVGVVHLTGITPALSARCADLVSRLLDDDARVTVFDVNHRPALWSAGDAAAPLLGLARRADVVLVGLDEAHRLWGTATARAVRDLLPDVRELVVKDADRSAWAWAGREVEEVPALPVDVVEAVGAGDAFAAGYVAGRLRGHDLRTALRQGHVLAAATLGDRSDTGRPPGAELLEAALTGRGWPGPPTSS